MAYSFCLCTARESVAVLSLSTGADVLANVITGVALVDAGDDDVSFYFGCVAQATGMGGAGLFVGSRHDASARRVHELHGNDSSAPAVGEIRAGAMFVADSDMCDVDAIWRQITGRNSAVGNSARCYLALVATVVVMLFLTTTSVNSC